MITTYTVVGMTCVHCAAEVADEVSDVAGVDDVRVDLDSGAVTVLAEGPVPVEAVAAAVRAAGYAVA
jgi:copper chaperone